MTADPSGRLIALRVGDRVWLNEDIEQHNQIVVGTVTKVSPAGYVHVRWDEPTIYPASDFSPVTAATALKVVVDRDALPRHDWDCQKDQPDPPCLRCGVIQTDSNEHDACEAARSLESMGLSGNMIVVPASGTSPNTAAPHARKKNP